MIKRLVVLQNDALLQEEIAMRRSRAWPRSSAPAAVPAAVAAPTMTMPVAPPASHPHEMELGLKEIARKAALEAEKAVLKDVLDRVRWNRAEAARLLKISYKALLYKITAAGLDGKSERRSRPK